MLVDNDEVCSHIRMADKQVGALKTDEQVDSMSSGVWLEVRPVKQHGTLAAWGLYVLVLPAGTSGD